MKPPKLNILFIAPYVPSLVRVRPYNLIRELKKRGHRITLLAPWSDQAEYLDLEEMGKATDEIQGAPLTDLRSYWNCFRVLPSQEPLQMAYCWQPSLANAIGRLINSNSNQEQFDVVHVEHLRAARYGLRVKKVLSDAQQKIPIIWDSVDCISLLFRQTSTNGAGRISRWMARIELPRTERYEAWLPSQFDRVIVTSSQDAAALRALEPQGRRISVVRNGVDLGYEAEGDQPAVLMSSR